MAGGRPRKYADIQDANAARRAHRQARSAQNGINALTSLVCDSPQASSLRT